MEECKVIEFVSPNSEKAFSSEKIYKYVVNHIDFALTEDQWESIDEAFAYYWDVEVGIGNEVHLDACCNSIQKHLIEKHKLISYDRIVQIVNHMFDYIGQIPGAFLEFKSVK